MNTQQPVSLGFLTPDSVTAEDAAPYAVLPIPYERTVSFGHGTARGPAAILEASQQIEDIDDEFLEPLGLSVQTLPALDFAGLNDEQAMALIRAAAKSVLKERRFLLSLGGEHTITAPLVAAAKSVYGQLSVLQIDAHADLRTEYTGTPFSHACVMRRIREMGVPTVGVGIRSISSGEYSYVRAEDVRIVWAKDIAEARDSAWIDAVVRDLRDPVYITVDMDGLDPSLVPGTGTPEPGGLAWRQLTALLRAVYEAHRVVAADVVELAPIAGTNVSEYVAARVATKLMLYHRRRCL